MTRGDPQALRVATFNIRTGRVWDVAHCWPLRGCVCAAALYALDADVAGLQKAHGFQERFLRGRLDGYAAAGAGRDDGRGKGERCSVLFRYARLSLES